jgi:hypothetical protein
MGSSFLPLAKPLTYRRLESAHLKTRARGPSSLTPHRCSWHNGASVRFRTVTLRGRRRGASHHLGVVAPTAPE